MPFIDEDLGDVREQEPAPEGEYDLRIVRAQEKEAKSGREMVQVILAFDDGTDAAAFSHFLMKWTDDDDEEQVLNRKREIKRFCAAFGIDTSFEVEELAGLTAKQIHVIQEEGDDNIVRNKIRLPRLREEGPVSTGRGRKR